MSKEFVDSRIDMFRTYPTDFERKQLNSLIKKQHENAIKCGNRLPQTEKIIENIKNNSRSDEKNKVLLKINNIQTIEYSFKYNFSHFSHKNSSFMQKIFVAKSKKCTSNQYASVNRSSGRVSSNTFTDEVYDKANNTHCETVLFTVCSNGKANQLKESFDRKQFENNKNQTQYSDERRRRIDKRTELTKQNNSSVLQTQYDCLNGTSLPAVTPTNSQTVMGNQFYDVLKHCLCFRIQSKHNRIDYFIGKNKRKFQTFLTCSSLSFPVWFSLLLHSNIALSVNIVMMFHCVLPIFHSLQVFLTKFFNLFFILFITNFNLFLRLLSNIGDILSFLFQLERFENYLAEILCCFYIFNQQVNQFNAQLNIEKSSQIKTDKHREPHLFNITKVSTLQNHKKYCFENINLKSKRKAAQNHCDSFYSAVIYLILFIFFIEFQFISAQFPNDEIEAALEVPPAIVYTPKDHHRHRTEQKQTEIGLNITKILNAFFDSGYDKRVRPNYAGPPVEVGVTMHIISISSISAIQMDFTSDFYFRQAWNDSRLSFEPRPNIEALYVGSEVSEKIWVPDTFFANEKSAQFHMATTPNTFIRIKANGEVFRSMRLTVTSNCPMNLQYFPMDRQSCTIEVESYGYSMADIQYKWGIDGKGSVNLANNLELPQFKVNKHRQMAKIEVLSTGNYSRLVCEIEFVRSMGYYLIQIYIPASLIVIISWVSFWLHRNASPARVQLGVTTVLTMTTLMSSTNAAMPKISYIKSIDVFLGTCFVMVFAALLEYATVGYMGKRIAMRKSRTQQIVRMLNEHRERCIAAAAAAAAAATAQQSNGKIDDDIRFGSQSGASTNIGMVRTASLYQDLDDGTLHKRDSRSGSCYQKTPYGPITGATTLHRSLERTASMKSRIYSDCDDADQTGMSNFNDDLSVFVQNTGNETSGTVGGSVAGVVTGAGSLNINAQDLGTYQFQERHSDSWLPNRGITIGGPLNDRPLYLPSNYVLKDHNTLFGVCPSDIDKYSRVVFPVCFLCFNLMYWIIYMHISEFLIDDQGANLTTQTVTDSVDSGM